MTDEPNGGSVATGRDEPRPAATNPDHDYSLSIEDAANAYVRAGHPRTIRTLQRYCVNGHLDCQRKETTWGDKFMVAPYSVSRHIAQIAEIAAQNPVATGRDEPRPAATGIPGDALKIEPTPATTGDDKTRPVATEPQPEKKSDEGRGAANSTGFDAGYVTQLEKRIDEKDDVIGLLKQQLGAKDQQITDLSTRFGNLSDRFADTQKLLGAMQRMFAPLLGQGDPYKREVEDPPAST